jgi:hypothetical protein
VSAAAIQLRQLQQKKKHKQLVLLVMRADDDVGNYQEPELYWQD